MFSCRIIPKQQQVAISRISCPTHSFNATPLQYWNPQHTLAFLSPSPLRPSSHRGVPHRHQKKDWAPGSHILPMYHHLKSPGYILQGLLFSPLVNIVWVCLNHFLGFRVLSQLTQPKARFPLGEFVRATRSENKNPATWLVDEAANFFANQSRCWILVFASRRPNKFA